MAFCFYYLEHSNFFSLSLIRENINKISICLLVVCVYFDNSKCLINACFIGGGGGDDFIIRTHYPIANLVWSLTLFSMLISNENTNLVRVVLENSSCLQEAGKLSFGNIDFLTVDLQFFLRSRYRYQTLASFFKAFEIFIHLS